MKQNPKNRYNGRYNNNRSNRSLTQNITRHTALESTGPCGKLHGTALQLFEKYTQAAKDALIQNDRILSETCLQFADHYARLQNIAIENEQNMRLNKRPAPMEQPASEQAIAPIAEPDALPDFDVPAPSNAEEELSAEDKTVQAMDLSIPITVMQENHRHPAKRATRHPRASKPQQTAEVIDLSPTTPDQEQA